LIYKNKAIENFSLAKEKRILHGRREKAIDRSDPECRAANKRRSRVFVESKCRFVDPVDRAQEIFLKLKMNETELRNATLVYVAVKHKQAAVFGDEGIHQKTGEKYWQDVVQKMLLHFKQEKLADGICQGITDLGQALKFYFPFDRQTDKNELPDEIVFGK
jgi:uncharacterized membrane protein